MKERRVLYNWLIGSEETSFRRYPKASLGLLLLINRPAISN